MIELGLDRIARLLAHTSLPWRAIHVAGTNGKGSICAYISKMLEVYNDSSYRKKLGQSEIQHGRYTSPHITERSDCVSIRQRPGLEWGFHEIEQRVLDRDKTKSIGASEFEVTTATAFEVFTASKLDVAVIEVGMGGRLDATNIIGQSNQQDHETTRTGLARGILRPPPLVTAISKIGLDHQNFLGNTIEAIAREKAGIIKPRVPVVFDMSNEATVCQILNETASSAASPVVTWSDLGFGPLKVPRNLHVSGQDEHTEDFNPASLGELGQVTRKSIPLHTQSNLSVAFRSTWAALIGLGRISKPDASLHVDELQLLADNMTTSALETVIPGRQECVDIGVLTGRKTSILLDGAHNAQSAAVLAAEVQRLRSHSRKRVTWVIAASDSKNVSEILQPILRENDSVFAVEFGRVDNMPWVKPLSSPEILSAARDIVPNLHNTQSYGPDVLGALRAAADQAASVVVVAGSLYLVGHVHRLLQSQ